MSEEHAEAVIVAGMMDEFEAPSSFVFFELSVTIEPLLMCLAFAMATFTLAVKPLLPGNVGPRGNDLSFGLEQAGEMTHVVEAGHVGSF